MPYVMLGILVFIIVVQMYITHILNWFGKNTKS